YLMIGAGIWLLLIPWLKHPLLDLGETFGLRFAVLIAAFVLFAPPLTLLGMISPYAIRLRAERLEEVGRTA
ncbi:MAG: SAM-dependent methyltransferase, partial [Calditrichaeota bacterium]|nr:SAM-dependent methyltransferase [Calditrichota bacterium]